MHPAGESTLNAGKKGTNALHAALSKTRGRHSATAAKRDKIDNASALAGRGANRTARWQLEAAVRAFEAHAPDLDNGTREWLRLRLENARRSEDATGTSPAGNGNQAGKGKR